MKFGIGKLDEMLGEIKMGSVILIEGVGDIPLILSKKFLKNATEMGLNVFAMVPERIERLLSDLNVRIIESSEYTCYELFTISLTIKRIEERVGLIMIFQQLLLIHELGKVYSLLREVCQHVRESSGVVIVTIDKRLADERTLAVFESEADYVIDVEERIEGLSVRRGIRVKKSVENLPSEFYELKMNDEIHIGDVID